jgi:hypothetical protein
VARDDGARGPTLKCAACLFPFISSLFLHFRSLDPTLPLFAFLLISCYPGLRLTNRFRLRALRVSTFPSLPFFSVLNGRNVLIWLFSFLCLFVFFLRSRTPIDDPFSPTRPIGKHLSIPTLLFSFERSDYLLPFLCLMLFSCAFLLLFPFVQHAIVCFGMHYILSKHVSAQRLHFMCMNVCMYKWAFVGTHAHTHAFGNIGNERCENFF